MPGKHIPNPSPVTPRCRGWAGAPGRFFRRGFESCFVLQSCVSPSPRCVAVCSCRRRRRCSFHLPPGRLETSSSYPPVASRFCGSKAEN